jgi:hypothetical protein
MVQGTLPVVPTRASLMPGNRLASPSAIPSRAVNNTRFYSKSPTPARPESFNQRAAQIQQMVRQNPLGTSNYGTRPGANPRPMTPSTQGQSGNSGWQRFASREPSSSLAQRGQPPRSSSSSTLYSTTRPQPGPADRSFQSRPGAPQQGSNQGGWQRFSRQNQPAPSSRGREWNAPAPRSQSSAPGWGRYSSGGYGSRPSLNFNKPIVVQRSTAPRSYGGGRGYSAPSGGGRGSSGGGGHSAPAPSHGGGGGGGSHGRR